jgi:hypothetical protein
MGKINEIEMADRCFYKLFYYETKLTRCPELPLTNLSQYCYNLMFFNCSNLITLPKLPATNLPSYCYNKMFSSCDSIKISTTQSDEYPYAYRIPTEGTATTGTNVHYDMFSNTGGSFVPTGLLFNLGTTYYTSNEIV